MIDAYAVLGVTPDATQDQLKAAHRALVRRHHPDLAPPHERDAATRRVQDINVAYGLVRDAGKRAEYDRLRRSGTAAALDAALLAAGRWAGRWWRRNRVVARRGAARARLSVHRGAGRGRRVAADTIGRLLWAVLCAIGAFAGWVLVSAVQQVSGASGYLAPLAATLGGLGVGSQRGYDLRLRLAGIPTSPITGRLAVVAWAAAVAVGFGLDALFT
jgi:curved DNA-binding protein CbpA